MKCVHLRLSVCVCVCVCVLMIWESRKLSMTHVTCDWVRVCFQFSQKAYTPLSFQWNESKIEHVRSQLQFKKTKTHQNKQQTNKRTNEQRNNARQILCDFWSFKKILRVALMSINRTNNNLYTQTKRRNYIHLKINIRTSFFLHISHSWRFSFQCAIQIIIWEMHVDWWI